MRGWDGRCMERMYGCCTQCILLLSRLALADTSLLSCLYRLVNSIGTSSIRLLGSKHGQCPKVIQTNAMSYDHWVPPLTQR